MSVRVSLRGQPTRLRARAAATRSRSGATVAMAGVAREKYPAIPACIKRA